MKKVLIVLAVVAFASLSNAASYRQKVAWLDNNNQDSTSITLQARIKECIMENCSRVQHGEKVRADFTNNVQFTEAQLQEFAARGTVGLMYERMKPHFAESNQVSSSNLNVTDAQLDAIFFATAWAVIRLIGTGVL